jgi:hypothetical protein
MMLERIGDESIAEVLFSPMRTGIFRLAGDVQDGVGFVWVLLQHFNRLGCWKHQQFDFPAPGFLLYLFHDRQCPSSRANHEPLAFPRYLLFDR